MSKTSQRKQSKSKKPTTSTTPQSGTHASGNTNIAQIPPKMAPQKPVNHRPILPQRAARKR
jgi:hypothetical protein